MKTFSIIDSIGVGAVQIWRDRRLLAPLTVIPILVMLVTALIARHILGIEDMLLVAVVQLPAEFVRAMLMVIYLRFLLLKELPVFLKGDEDRERGRQIVAGVVSLVTVSYLFMGVLNLVRSIIGQIEQGNADQAMAVP